MENSNPLDIAKRLDIKHNVTIRVMDEATGKVIQEHEGHNAATNSMLTGIAHYLMGDGVLNQGVDMLSTWVPQYISVGTMGLTSQESETFVDKDGKVMILPKAIGSTPCAPANATGDEIGFNTQTRFEEYINQTPGFGADGYDANTNNNREWFGLGYPYTDRPSRKLLEYFNGDGITADFTLANGVESLSSVVIFDKLVDGSANSSAHSYTLPPKVYIVGKPTSESITTTAKLIPLTYKAVAINSVTADGVPIDYSHDPNSNYITLNVLDEGEFTIEIDYIADNASDLAVPTCVSIREANYIPEQQTRVAITYFTTDVEPDAANCELITPITSRSKITYRNIIPEVQSEIPDTIDVVYSAFLSTGALAQFRGNNDYIFITEVGLWSKPTYNNSGDNGLLAGYRIMPTDDEPAEINSRATFTGDGQQVVFHIDDSKAIDVVSVTVDGTPNTSYSFDYKTKELTFIPITKSSGEIDDDNHNVPPAGSTIIVVYTITNSWKDMSEEANRRAVQKSIIRVGKNQVAQIIWKLQLGGLEQLNGLRYIYPTQYPTDVWEVWTNN